MCAEEDDDNTFTNAAAFYRTYGNRKIVYHEGAFYYASRGKAGSPDGIRYGVEGQKFSVVLEDGTRYTADIALDDGSGNGSCRRISYVNENGYQHSLYQVSYDGIISRLQKKYPDTDFSKVMYNRQIAFQIDFYLCLVINGESQGGVVEKEDGKTVFQGTVYASLSQILAAANWSKETQEALEYYYDIQMSVYQSSVWYLSFYKNSSAASGKMDQQEFTYNQKAKISACAFRKIITVTLEPGEGTWEGNQLVSVSNMLQCRFLGWSLTAKGDIVYADQEEVKNLSDQQGAVIPLYANWSEESMILPEFYRDDCVFLGWSLTELETLSCEAGEEEIEGLKLYESGSSFTPKEDTVLYAVWKWKSYKVKFLEPDADGISAESVRNYSWDVVQTIRGLIEESGFAGRELNRRLIGGEFA